MKTLLASKKKKIVRELGENFGIGKVDGLFLQFGKEKIRVYNGSLSKEELIGLDKNARLQDRLGGRLALGNQFLKLFTLLFRKLDDIYLP